MNQLITYLYRSLSIVTLANTKSVKYIQGGGGTEEKAHNQQ